MLQTLAEHRDRDPDELLDHLDRSYAGRRPRVGSCAGSGFERETETATFASITHLRFGRPPAGGARDIAAYAEAPRQTFAPAPGIAKNPPHGQALAHLIFTEPGGPNHVTNVYTNRYAHSAVGADLDRRPYQRRCWRLIRRRPTGHVLPSFTLDAGSARRSIHGTAQLRGSLV